MIINPDKTKIILIGNSTFRNWDGTDKVSVEKDILNVKQNIESLKNIFLDKTIFGIPNDGKHLITITDEPAQEILLRVKHETQTERDQFERLIFYYAGHGIPGDDGKLFFASKDTIRSDYEITSVDSSRLFSYLNRFGVNELIVILDCCYAAQSKENLGDADSLIEKCLPEEKNAQEIQENGTYYLFASGKDNVAKFNPTEPETPTYFTMALLKSISEGTEAGVAFIEIGKLFQNLQLQILQLKKDTKTDIPNPRPILVGDANGFLFCKNIKFENQEDKDWAEILKDPTLKKLEAFEEKYPNTRFEAAKDDLRNRLIEGIEAIKNMKEPKDLRLANKIKSEYKDIPMFRDAANKFMRDLAAKAISDENEIEREVLSSRRATDATPDHPLKQTSGSSRPAAEAANEIPGLKSDTGTENKINRQQGDAVFTEIARTRVDGIQ